MTEVRAEHISMEMYEILCSQSKEKKYLAFS